MNKEEKVAAVAAIKETLGNAEGVILTDFQGLTVKEITELRKTLRAANITYDVVKNTLAELAAQEAQIEGLEDYFKGPTAIAVSEDPVAPAKIISDFAKTHRKLTIKAGVVGGKVVDADAVKELAKLPSREVLLAQVVGGLAAPISGFLNVLSGNIRNLVYVLDAIKAQKEA